MSHYETVNVSYAPNVTVDQVDLQAGLDLDCDYEQQLCQRLEKTDFCLNGEPSFTDGCDQASSATLPADLIREVSSEAVIATQDEELVELTLTRVYIPEFREDGTPYHVGDLLAPCLTKVYRKTVWVPKDYHPFEISRSFSSSSDSSTNSTEMTAPEGESVEEGEQASYSERIADIQDALGETPMLDRQTPSSSSTDPIDLPHIASFPSFATPSLNKCPPRPSPTEVVIASSQKELTPTSSSTISIDQFDILQVIGKGSEGHVYKVARKGTNSIYALKVALDIYKEDGSEKKEGQVGWLRDEQGIMKSLSDMEGFVTLEASWNDSKNFYFLSPLYATDMEAEIKRCNRIPKHRALFYFAELVIALKNMHSRGIIHRDIKPSNLMIDFDGHIVLGDFGLSEDFGFEPTLAEYTTQPYYPYWASDDLNEYPPLRPLETLPYVLNGFCGSPPHMAPEVWKKEPYSFPVDWWSAGTTFYNMITGRFPFWVPKNEVRQNLGERIINGSFHFLPFDTVDRDAKDLCFQLLMKEPKERIPIRELEFHPYFKGVDWDGMRSRKLPPPYIPQENYVIQERLEPFIPGDTYPDGQNPWPDFEYVSPALQAAGVRLPTNVPMTKPFVSAEDIIDMYISLPEPMERQLSNWWEKLVSPLRSASRDLDLSVRSPSFFTPTCHSAVPMTSTSSYHSAKSEQPIVQPLDPVKPARTHFQRVTSYVKHAFTCTACPASSNRSNSNIN